VETAQSTLLSDIHSQPVMYLVVSRRRLLKKAGSPETQRIASDQLVFH